MKKGEGKFQPVIALPFVYIEIYILFYLYFIEYLEKQKLGLHVLL